MADKPGINRKLLRDAGIGAVLILLIVLLQSYSEPQRVASHSLPSATDAKEVPGEESYASYQFDAVYAKGQAHVTLKLMEQGTHFEVLAMNIVIRDGTAA